MKKYLVALSLWALISCQPTESKQEPAAQPQATTQPVDLEKATFDDLFKSIEPKQMDVNVFKLLNEDWSVVTAGNESDYNSMIASWGAYGVVFEKPAAWLLLNASRFTLEKIKTYNTFTLSYLDSTYTDQKMIFGKTSGRNSDKMKESTLHPVVTPEGNMSYKEAYMIVELQLESLMEVKPENFKTEDHRKFLQEGKEKGNGKEYHNMVIGVIKCVWVRK